MARMDVFCRETHIDRTLINYSQLAANDLQIFRSIYLCTEHILYITRINIALFRDLVKGILCIALAVIVLTEPLYVI